MNSRKGEEMKPVKVTIKVDNTEKIREALEVISSVKKNHPNAEFYIEVIM